MTSRARTGLYFILNPSLGIIKIGITEDLAGRKKSLECACGVPLDLMRFVADAQRFEKPLHAVFAETRLRGEWFSPSVELVGLADGDESIDVFVARKAPEIAASEAASRAAGATEREARLEAQRLRREERARLAAERLLRERERLARQEKARAAKEERERAAFIAAQAAWVGRTPAVITNRVLNPERASEVEARKSVVAQQRLRNATLLGIPSTGVVINA